jgi:hypothetical protein
MKRSTKNKKEQLIKEKKVRITSRKKISLLDELIKDKKWEIEHDEKKFRI